VKSSWLQAKEAVDNCLLKWLGTQGKRMNDEASSWPAPPFLASVTHIIPVTTVVTWAQTQAIFDAVRKGNLEEANRLLERNRNLLDARRKV